MTAGLDESPERGEGGHRIPHVFETVMGHDQAIPAFVMPERNAFEAKTRDRPLRSFESLVDPGQPIESHGMEPPQQTARAASDVEDPIVEIRLRPAKPSDASAATSGQQAAGHGRSKSGSRSDPTKGPPDPGPSRPLGSADCETVSRAALRPLRMRIIDVAIVSIHVVGKARDLQAATLDAFDVFECITQSEHHFACDESRLDTSAADSTASG